MKEKKRLEKAWEQHEQKEKVERKIKAKDEYTEWLKDQVTKLNEQKERKFEKMRETRREQDNKKIMKINCIEESKTKIEQYLSNVRNLKTSQRGGLMIPFEEWLNIKKVEKEMNKLKNITLGPEKRERNFKEKKIKENRTRELNLTKKEKFDKIKESFKDYHEAKGKVKRKEKKKNRKIALEEDIQNNPSREIERESQDNNPEFDNEKFDSNDRSNKNDKRNLSGNSKNKFSGSKGEFTQSSISKND